MLAMTSEGLNSKADIAKQLAYRDKEIERLKSELSGLAGTPDIADSIVCNLSHEACQIPSDLSP